jgi:hypothetical protein
MGQTSAICLFLPQDLHIVNEELEQDSLTKKFLFPNRSSIFCPRMAKGGVC